jgi:hypothetical protein
MEKITSCICWSDDVENFPHVIEDGGSLGSFVIILVSMKPMLDLENASSIGLRSGEYGGRYSILTPEKCQKHVQL